MALAALAEAEAAALAAPDAASRAARSSSRTTLRSTLPICERGISLRMAIWRGRA